MVAGGKSCSFKSYEITFWVFNIDICGTSWVPLEIMHRSIITYLWVNFLWVAHKPIRKLVVSYEPS